MEHKPIYLDGVDVSECKCLHNVKVITELAQPEDFEILCGATNGAIKCEKWKDCYFKQLARKTQECEELKAYAQRQENQREEYYKEYQKLKQDLFLAQNQITLKNEYIQKVKQESEELKRKVELMMDCPDCKVDEYKQALDEIKSICLKDVHTFADGTELRYDSLDDILDIINKAKEK